MELRTLGWTGVPIPTIGQGTWRMEADDRAQAIRAIRRGIDRGLTHVDTAEMYGSGLVEEMVGEAIAGRRDELFLASKVLPSNASRSGTIEACERSLKALRTDRLDLYLLHWPGSEPLEETIAAFERLVETGKIRFWGVSNFDVEDLEEARSIAGPDRIACNQVLYHLQERAMEYRVLPWCESHRIAVVGYSPLGSGDFPAPGTGGRRVLDEIGRAHGATAHQVALAFLVRRPSLFTIPKAADPAHAEANAKAGDLRLSAAELARIDAAFPARQSAELPVL